MNANDRIDLQAQNPAAAPLQIAVNSPGDTTNPNDGVVTLREAIAEAEVAFKAGQSAVITVDVGFSDISLIEGELVIRGTSAAKGISLTIQNTVGEPFPTISQGGDGGSARVLHIAGGAAAGDSQLVTLKGLILSGGEADVGGGLLAENAVLTLKEVDVNDSKALGTAGSAAVLGGGIALLDSQTTMENCEINSNSAGQGAAAAAAPVLGGGIYVGGGSLTFTSRINVETNTVNTAGDTAGGGGIAVKDATLTINDARIQGNSVDAASTFGGTAAGGGLYLNGTAAGSIIGYSSITGNKVNETAAGQAFGGGLQVRDGAITVDHSYLGGNAISGVPATVAMAGSAISSRLGDLTVANSTIYGNSLAGGPDPKGTLFIAGGEVSILGSTIAGNKTPGDGSYAGIVAVETAPTVRNSILANGPAGGSGAYVDVFGGIASDGHNLFTQAVVGGSVAGDLLATDPKLAAPADNGGPTNTSAPLAGSPVLDAGADADAVGSTDQRGAGFARISGTHTDIGAFETQQAGGALRLFTPGDDAVDLRQVDLALYPATLGTDALAGDDTVHLSSTQNLGTLFIAGQGDDVIFGSSRGDKITGSQGDDRIGGGGGEDLLYGGIGNDRLHGDGGKDTLKGSAGADTFIFTKMGDSPTGSGRDMILDFTQRQGDLIDLGKIDANAGIGGNQAFAWKGAGPLTGVGQLHYRYVGGDTIVEGNVSGSAAPEVQIELHGHLTLAAGDFLL